MTAEQIALIEEGGYALMRSRQYRRGLALLSLALELRYAAMPPVEPESRLADVVSLDAYSRKAPCA